MEDLFVACNICHESVKEFSELTEELEEIIELIGAKINVSSKPTLICSKCSEMLKIFDGFKERLIKIDEDLLSYILDSNSVEIKSELDESSDLSLEHISNNFNANLKVDINNECSNTTIKTEYYQKSKLCKLCEKNINDSSSQSLMDLLKDLGLKERMEEFFIELDINLSNASVCEACVFSLDALKNFLSKLDFLPLISETSNQKIEIKFKKKINTSLNGASKSSVKILDVSLASKWAATKVNIDLKCDICGYESQNQRIFTKHRLLHKKSSEIQIYACEYCGFLTRYKESIKRHSLVHEHSSEQSDEFQTHNCTICTFQTKYKHNLKSHLLTHKNVSDIEMYQCKFCDYKSKYKQGIKKHEIVHKNATEIHIHKCKLCNFETKYKYNLKSHLKVHQSQSECTIYACSQCSYVSKRKHHLTRHSLRHSM